MPGFSQFTEQGRPAVLAALLSHSQPIYDCANPMIHALPSRAIATYEGRGCPHLLKNVTFSTGSRDTTPNLPIGHPIGKIAKVSAFSGSPNASFTSFSYSRWRVVSTDPN